MLNVPKVGPVPKVAPTDAAPAAVAAAAGAPLQFDPNTIKLTKPIKSHTGTLYELKIREPVAMDYIEIGRVPFDVRGDMDNRRAMVDFACAAKWISRLTGQDEIILGQLTGPDFLAVVGRVNAILLSTDAADLGN